MKSTTPKISYTAYLTGSLTLTAQGEWRHNGLAFQNERISELFHHAIQFDQQLKCFVVRLGEQQATFEVEDVAYFVRTLDTTSSPWRITLNNGHSEILRPESLCIGINDRLYCSVKDGFEACFLRSAYQQISSFVDESSAIQVDGVAIVPYARRLQ